MTDQTLQTEVQTLNLAYPLDVFYEIEGRTLPRFERVSGGRMPEPYRSLLVGQHDMTPTLESFHGVRLGLTLLDRLLDGDRYSRLVILIKPDGTPVEFGAIVINLDCLPDDGRAAVLEGKTPLGTVLAQYSIVHSSCPLGFVRVEPDQLMRYTLRLRDDRELFGRRNVLRTEDGRILAEILEILPTADAD